MDAIFPVALLLVFAVIMVVAMRAASTLHQRDEANAQFAAAKQSESVVAESNGTQSEAASSEMKQSRSGKTKGKQQERQQDTRAPASASGAHSYDKLSAKERQPKSKELV